MFTLFCLAVATIFKLNTTRKEVYGIVESVTDEHLIFKDKNQVNYIIKKQDYVITKNHFKKNSKIFVTFTGDILEVSPVRFEKILNVEKGRD